jgi:Acetohydroxy acid isomeroreductase, catalytic domain
VAALRLRLTEPFAAAFRISLLVMCFCRRKLDGSAILADTAFGVAKDYIQSGLFTRDWMLENQVNQTSFTAMRAKAAAHPIEEVGARLPR